jgi:hypothetical protein
VLFKLDLRILAASRASRKAKFANIRNFAFAVCTSIY